MGLADTRRFALSWLDIAVGDDWSAESSDSWSIEATAAGAPSSIHTVGDRGIHRQYHYGVPLLHGNARFLHAEHRLPDQNARHTACRRKPAALLLHERLPNMGEPRTR